MASPLKAYETLVRNGTLMPDPAQAEAIKRLDTLARALQGYDPTRKPGLFQRRQKTPTGVYLWGGVGVGKSLLMDLFVENAPIRAKRRVHFHAFMQEVHRFIAEWRTMDDAVRRRHPARVKAASLDDPIPHAARAVFQEAHLFCFDEFHVTDIADAMLLGRLFANLFDMGAVVVATSNRVPDDLYKDGINRGLFLPFIEMLNDRLDVLKLVGAKDYRMDRLQNEPVYFHPLGKPARAAMEKAWRDMTAGADDEEAHLTVLGRTVLVPMSARGNARGDFDHWCRSNFGPSDYLALAQHYRVVFIDDIPKMGPADRNVAKRFVTLIDALYEARCTLICSADARPEDLYPSGDGAFEFERTVSRLNEMQSSAYLSLEHTADIEN